VTVYTLRYEKRPWTLNSERQGGHQGRKGGGGHFGRASRTKEWREKFAELAADCRPLRSIEVVVLPEVRNKVMPDTGACIGAAKAAIDGLVDAGVIPDDGPRFVRRLTFLAPVVTGVDALVLRIEGDAA
jgi:hypothetical protein